MRFLILIVESNVLAVPRLVDCVLILALWMRKGSQRPSLVLTGQQVPSVDVFITYCGEDLDVVLDTARAACALDYPIQSFRVFVLDDSGSQELAEAIAKRRKLSNNNLYYTSRGEKVNGHCKAANLNWGLEYAHLQEGGSAELLAVLDVDMIPERNWLRSLIPHIYQDERVGMVNSPQNYYNNPDNNRFGAGAWMIRFCHVTVPMMDRANKANCHGTGFVVRKETIDDIGGFPTQSALEDHLTSCMLNFKGWVCVHVSEPLQWGLGPSTAQSHIRQMQRITGAAVMMNEHLPRPNNRKMNPSDRLAAVIFFLPFTLPYCTAAFNMVLVPLLLVFVPVKNPVWGEIQSTRFLITLAVSDFAAQVLHGFVLSRIAYGRVPILHHFEALWVGPQVFVTVLNTLGLLKRREEYRPTGCKTRAEARASRLASSWERLKFAFDNGPVLFHGAVFAMCILGACASIYDAIVSSDELVISTVVSHYIARAGWPPLLSIWTACAANAWIPFSCAIFPPKRVPRKDLVVEHADVDAAYPSLKAKRNWYAEVREWHLATLIIYHLIVLEFMLGKPV